MQPYLLNPAQQELINCGVLTSGFSSILQMPTGTGKTWLAKLAIRHSVDNGLRAIYLTPLRALASELVVQWTKDFNGIKVGIFTGDYSGRSIIAGGEIIFLSSSQSRHGTNKAPANAPPNSLIIPSRASPSEV